MSVRRVAVVSGGHMKGTCYEIVKALCSQFDGIVYLTGKDEKRGLDACKKLAKELMKVVKTHLNFTSLILETKKASKGFEIM
jgi:UDP-N-acetylmuramoylalanine-D-glutamate ligase